MQTYIQRFNPFLLHTLLPSLPLCLNLLLHWIQHFYILKPNHHYKFSSHDQTNAVCFILPHCVMHSLLSCLLSSALAVLLFWVNTTHPPDHHSFRYLKSCHIIDFLSPSVTRISQDIMHGYKPCILFLSLWDELSLMIELEQVPWTLPMHNVLLFLMPLLLLHLHQSSVPNFITCLRIPTYRAN